MPASLKEIHSNLLYIDTDGNLVLNTLGNLVNTMGSSAFPPRFLVVGAGSYVFISAAAGATNISDVSFQVTDGQGDVVTGVFTFDIYLSDSASGAGLAAHTATGGVAATAGVILAVLTAAKALRVQTNGAGLFTLAITDTAKTAYYPVAVFNGPAIVGTQLVTGNYG